MEMNVFLWMANSQFSQTKTLLGKEAFQYLVLVSGVTHSFNSSAHQAEAGRSVFVGFPSHPGRTGR